MAAKKKKQPIGVKEKDMSSWKPGSDPAAAKDVGAKGDFGVAAGEGSERDREYTSANTRHSDPGASLPAAWEHDGVRDHGAGVPDSGPGSGSGGDLDTDIIGIGSGSGISISGPSDRHGADEATDATSSSRKTPIQSPPKQAHGSFVAGEGEDSPFASEGTDASNNPAAEDDDSFAGEISRGEGRGEDNSLKGT